MLYKISKGLGFLIYKLFFNIQIIGSEKIPEEGPVIIIANHKSAQDPLLITSMVKRQIYWMAKIELFENKFLAKILYKLGAFPVDRDIADIAAIKKSILILRNNSVLGIFPEGTRVKEFDENMIKPGIAMIAQRTKSKVVPIYIEGNYKIFRKMRLIVRDPIDFSEIPKLTNEEYSKLSVDIMKKVYFGD